jgi:hypothetical protein
MPTYLNNQFPLFLELFFLHTNLPINPTTYVYKYLPTYAPTFLPTTMLTYLPIFLRSQIPNLLPTHFSQPPTPLFYLSIY